MQPSFFSEKFMTGMSKSGDRRRERRRERKRQKGLEGGREGGGKTRRRKAK